MTLTPKERPILYAGEMVRALLREIDPKTQTRRTNGLEELNGGYYRDRIGKVECRNGLWCFWEIGHGSSALPVFTAKCPFGAPGDRLWVKETFQPMPHLNARAFYRASDGLVGGKWKPAIHMPRNLSRIILEITDVRVERLQEISEEDAKAEGAEKQFYISIKVGDSGHDFRLPNSYRGGFCCIWNAINKEHSWGTNPFVWVIGFRRLNAKATPEKPFTPTPKVADVPADELVRRMRDEWE